MINPLITILIASFNRLEFLKKSVLSCINQNTKNWRVLIVDDGSDIETKEWLINQRNNYEFIDVHFQENLGASHARQNGLQLVRTEYVCILDSDDFLNFNAIEIISEYIQNNENIDLFYSNNLEINPNGVRRESNYRDFPDNKTFLNALILYPRVPFKHSGTTFKLKKILENGGYDTSLTSKIDIELIARLLHVGIKVKLIKEPIISFNFHRNSISREKRIKGISVWFEIIEKYGPKSKIKNFIFKFARALFEGLKFIIERIKLGK